MKFWITTDTHFGHEKISELTGRPDGWEQAILSGLTKLKKGDILIHLGDVAWNDEGEDNYLTYCYALGIRPWLVLGNHDKSYTWHLNAGWHWVGDYMKMNRYGRMMGFSHRPTPDFDVDIQFHGHFHNANYERWEGELKSYINSRHRLLILEENDYAPVELEWAINHLKRTSTYG